MNKLKPVELLSPIILLGTGRSGTTVFMNGLFRHRELAFFTNILERKPQWMWTNKFRRLTDNSYYRLFPSQVNKPLDHFFLKPVEGYSIWNYMIDSEVNFAKSFLDHEYPSKMLKNRVCTYIEELIKTQNRSRFAFKITGPGRLTFLNILFPDACFIWLKRDFIPTLHSFLNVDFWQERSTGDLWWQSRKVEEILNDYQHIKKNPVLFTTLQLQAIISDIELSISNQNLNVLRIDYEEFAANPKRILQEALKFCLLDGDQDCFRYLENNKIENRNKRDTDYFDKETLNDIQDLRNSLINNYK